jgi:hypothetical protein
MAARSTLDVVEDSVRREVQAQERREDGVDAKAGLVLGFAGLLVSFGTGLVWPPLTLVARLLGAVAGLTALRAFSLGDAAALTAKTWSETDDPDELRRQLVTTLLAAHGHATAVYDTKVAHLRRAVRMLALGVAVTATGTTVEVLRELVR